MNIQNRGIFVLASLAMIIAIALDAMAAHVLKDVLDENHQNTWSIAGRYLLIQSLALIVLSLIKANSFFNISLQMIAFGMLAFSISLYTLCFIQFSNLGLVTPIGGVAMRLGWLGVIISVIKK
ncbi:MAG: DUF423 domain-containing protein [Saccharospirillaceae bacterium]|nr:DUF423 domain-containing protein [Pseudomonadales bacterium]NRB78802.1 DUF423 domain-containing protein [Saccharospirillaceae bacterium]